MLDLQRILWLPCLLVACNPEVFPDPEPPKLVAERVTATVKRGAAGLVRIRTDHEVLVTTPEHPFATPQAGWIPAGRLAAGDHVVSARYGALRVASVQQEKPVEPQAVFNLTVAPSHTYVVGTGQVLVHNWKCKDLPEREKEIEAVERELDELKLKFLVAAAEDRPGLTRQIGQVKRRLTLLKHARVNARARQRKAGREPEPGGLDPGIKLRSEGPERDPIGRTVRALEVIERSLREPGEASASSSQRLAELKRERGKLKHKLSRLRNRDRRQSGMVQVSRRERLLMVAEADYESRKAEVEAAQRELSALLGEAPHSDAEKMSHAERRATLDKKLRALQLERYVSEEILAAERRIAELAARSTTTDAERQQVAAERLALRTMISKQRTARRGREFHRRQRADPEEYEKRLRRKRVPSRRALRTPGDAADAERQLDAIERLEEELAASRQGVGGAGLEDRTEHLTEHIATLKSLVEIRRRRKRIKDSLRRARTKREALSNAAQNTQAIEQRIVRLEQEQNAIAVRGVQLRLRESVLKLLDGTTTDGLDTLEEDRLREFERELEGEIVSGRSLGEERLREIQQELGESELVDAEFLESIWREAAAEEGAGQELPETPQDEEADLGTLLRELAQSLQEPPLPERPAALDAGLRALQGELREERNAVESADFALANEQASLNQTPARPGASRHGAGVQRLAELQQQRLQLRIDWRARMQRRLDAARQELQSRQSSEGRRNPALEVELARRVALLEHEVQNPSF